MRERESLTYLQRTALIRFRGSLVAKKKKKERKRRRRNYMKLRGR